MPNKNDGKQHTSDLVLKIVRYEKYSTGGFVPAGTIAKSIDISAEELGRILLEQFAVAEKSP